MDTGIKSRYDSFSYRYHNVPPCSPSRHLRHLIAGSICPQRDYFKQCMDTVVKPRYDSFSSRYHNFTLSRRTN
jgi:RPE4 domain-containing protein